MVEAKSIMTKPTDATPVIREDVLRDPRYPVHRIADKLLPYLRVMVGQFQPCKLILFGSYAYGRPDQASDVDLLVVKDMRQSSLKEKLRIRKALNPVHVKQGYLSIHLLLQSPEGHVERLKDSAGFYDEINSRGLALL